MWITALVILSIPLGYLNSHTRIYYSNFNGKKICISLDLIFYCKSFCFYLGNLCYKKMHNVFQILLKQIDASDTNQNNVLTRIVLDNVLFY
jgi:hypothetical protein